jgi:hypothetical protein
MNRTPLNPLFCEHHWSQYRSDANANGRYAIKAVCTLAMHNPGILAAVKLVMDYHKVDVEEALRHTLEEMQTRLNRPLCCYLGDVIMEQVLTHSKNPPTGWKAS